MLKKIVFMKEVDNVDDRLLRASNTKSEVVLSELPVECEMKHATP
jgi:hypothetical protein